MGWYDLFSSFYDSSVEDVYLPFRDIAAQALDLAEGQTVLDAGCGTGQSFDVLSAGVGNTGRVLGVDASSGMLGKAKDRIANKGLDNVRVLERSLLELSRDDVAEHLDGEPGFDRALCFLVLTTQEGPDAFERVWSLLAPGGRMVIVDAHTEKLSFQGRMVNLTARADIRRRVWEPLEAASEGFTFERLDTPAKVGGDLICATGLKPA